ncbi:2-C-methyl-D-erythritol 2,4-cyclodiphosphate synthase [Candidatus Photodesmus katoptron]|uniref:2-C-methyl-D-erythritol 2,4-cyclodiphosphate synthase n=1 Tax=Candidatus Photodesmus katoptron Akat1 TaxID=1236703 RepID=S3DH24_9GAMM|nr:2-C-methyl-D-erythritol 2,4-cyclodiphosphate synthase [Candidatus Photodesmus katoptron]EPE37752.1 2C-methyl-D-erythritol 2,4-cyclodiphosphate synthase [Candidatus Photodesmus katoptron Akat1]KEY90526.1 2-C-methyl-D-erythritol 2,4-cyclodiphosphate synthase [Candidatus Photodesmus katoptron]
MRIGHGFDVHRFGGSGPLIIGGVPIPYKQGLIAHSDGDVVLHSLCDALLGAIGDGDIGEHFSNTDIIWKNVCSSKMLKHVYSKVCFHGYVLGNADITIIAQSPKMKPYVEMMSVVISKNLKTNINNINVKATTTEYLGFIGRKEGIACESVVLLK